RPYVAHESSDGRRRRYYRRRHRRERDPEMSAVDFKRRQVSGRGIPVAGNDIDTDRIIPARFLKAVTFEGMGEHAFEDAKKQNLEHPFNQKVYQGASVLDVGFDGGATGGGRGDRGDGEEVAVRHGVVSPRPLTSSFELPRLSPIASTPPTDARRRWPSPRPGALPASQGSPSAREGGAP